MTFFARRAAAGRSRARATASRPAAKVVGSPAAVASRRAVGAISSRAPASIAIQVRLMRCLSIFSAPVGRKFYPEPLPAIRPRISRAAAPAAARPFRIAAQTPRARELTSGLAAPIALRTWVRGAGVEDPADRTPDPRGLAGARLGEGADAHHPFRLQDADQASQVTVAGLEERLALGRGKLVRGAVAARRFQEGQRAVVRDVAAGRRSAPARRRPRQSRPTGARRSPRSGGSRSPAPAASGAPAGLRDRALDLQPVADVGDASERARPVWIMPNGPGFMPRKTTACGRAVGVDVAAVGRARVVEGVVDVGHRGAELQRRDVPPQLPGRGAELCGNRAGIGPPVLVGPIAYPTGLGRMRTLPVYWRRLRSAARAQVRVRAGRLR